MASGENGWIACQHTIHVGPDLNLFGPDASAHDGGCEIGPAAAESSGDAFLGARNESTHDDNVVLCERRNHAREPLVGLVVNGTGLRVAPVGHDELARIDVDGAHAAMLEMVGYDEAREALTEASDRIDRPGRQLTEDRQSLDEFAQLLEMFVDGALHSGFAQME